VFLRCAAVEGEETEGRKRERERESKGKGVKVRPTTHLSPLAPTVLDIFTELGNCNCVIIL